MIGVERKIADHDILTPFAHGRTPVKMVEWRGMVKTVTAGLR